MSKYSEEKRLDKQKTSKIYFRTHQKFGIIKETHESLYYVKVLLTDGSMAYKGNFLPVKNPWQELLQTFGPLRPGLLVELIFKGDQENTADVLVIGLESETIGSVQESPTVDLSLYEIFVPGV